METKKRNKNPNMDCSNFRVAFSCLLKVQDLIQLLQQPLTL